MKIISELTRIFFKYTSARAVLDGKISAADFPEDEYEQIAFHYMKQYSSIELKNMWNYYKRMLRKNRELKKKEGDIERLGIPVFDAVFYFAEHMLILERNRATCRYENLLQWHDLAADIGEELFIAAFWAREQHKEAMMRIGFSWPLVTEHNGYYLNRIIQRGISENHFHLYGSAPVFHISWLSLMNDMQNCKNIQALQRIDKSRRKTNIHYKTEYREDSLAIQYYQAALIRLFLFAKLRGDRLRIGNYMIPVRDVRNVVGQEGFSYFYQNALGIRNERMILFVNKITSCLVDNSEFQEQTYISVRSFIIALVQCHEDDIPMGAVDLEKGRELWMGELNHRLSSVFGDAVFLKQDFQEFVKAETDLGDVISWMLSSVEAVDLETIHSAFGLPQKRYTALWQSRTMENVIRILQNECDINDFSVEMQQYIDTYQQEYNNNGMYDKALVDYALLEANDWNYGFEQYNDIFSGEHGFLYAYLRKIWTRNIESEELRLFYAYILIKETLRSELVQSNQNVGFDNFQKYERRKMQMIHNPIYRNEMVRHAVQKNLLTQDVRSLEIRISPKSSMKENVENIQALDRIIGGDKNKYFYTLHFIKQQDDLKKRETASEMCRHFSLRQKISGMAESLVKLREHYPETARRILGIDAASQEIGCRPEVFATVFRYLKNHIYVYDDGMKKYPLQQLRTTYHVGEDFLDVTDGLRAIDEAVHFLNLECGDRMGHALALGINVEDWYASKGNQIAIPQQDYLDNIAWLYNQLERYHISDTGGLCDHLRREFHKYFEIIYLNNMKMGMMQLIIREAVKYEKIPPKLAAGIYNFQFNIYSYYDAWTLRGDDPQLYEKGYFYDLDDYLSIRHYMKNQSFPLHNSRNEAGDIRKKPEAFLLYYCYHFNSNVKAVGRKEIEVKITRPYIEAVKQVQHCMQFQIARMGIAVETNPTSNYLIGTFKDYRKHPILQFYNKGLVNDPKLLDACAQIPVSINTDDMGVFNTSLQNEYALLASSLESAVDENGKRVYDRTSIYQWLDTIRQMGNDQSFKWDENESGRPLWYSEEDHF